MADTTAVTATALVTLTLAAMTSLATHTTGVAITEGDYTAGTAVTEESTLALMAVIQAAAEVTHPLIRTKGVIRTMAVTRTQGVATAVTRTQGVAMAVIRTTTVMEPTLTTVVVMEGNRTTEVDIIITVMAMARTTQVVVAKQVTPLTLLATTALTAMDTAMGMDIHIIIKVAVTVMVMEAIPLESTLAVARTRMIITGLIITGTTQTIIVIITIQE